MDLRKRLIILFDEYPFETGEYSFVRTELKLLAEQFDVCIISLSPSLEQKMVTDARIRVYHCVRKFGFREKAKAVAGFLLSKAGRGEMRKIIRERQSIAGRLYDAIVYYGSADQLRKYVKRNHVISGNELIYSYWFNANCLAFLMDKEVYPGLKVVSRIHGYDLYDERNPHNRQPFREYMDKKVDHIFFVAKAGMQYYMKHWGDGEKIGRKYTIDPIGTVNDSFSPKKMSVAKGMRFTVVSCSSTIPLKRVNLIVEGLTLIEDIEIHWIHFGAGSHFCETEELARKLLSHKKNISYEMRGFVPVEEIMRFYDSHYVNCFLMTSSTEGCPVSVQEAMSYGIPIIATAVGEVPNMIEGSGILLSENPAPKEVQEAVSRLYATPEREIMQMRARARSVWEEKYDAKRNAENFWKRLYDVCDPTFDRA